MSKYKLVPVEPTQEMIDAGRTARTHPAERYKAMLAAAPAAQGEPVAWYLPSEAGYDSCFRDHATIQACTANPWTGWLPLYLHPHPAEQQPDDAQHQLTCWAVYDSELGFIRVHADTDCLALFDSEKGAAVAVRENPGTAYKKLVLHREPQQTPETTLLEAFDAGRRTAQEEVHRLREWIKETGDQLDICTHSILKKKKKSVTTAGVGDRRVRNAKRKEANQQSFSSHYCTNRRICRRRCSVSPCRVVPHPYDSRARTCSVLYWSPQVGMGLGLEEDLMFKNMRAEK